jgi:hypothetical protein
MGKNRTIVRVRDRDRGWSKLRRQVFGLDKHVTVGVHGEDDSRKGGAIGNVELMTVHEFGSDRAGIPERSVIRYTIDRNVTQYRRFIKALGQQVYRVRITTKQALEILGLKVASDMRRTIDKTPGAWPALEAATVAAREYGGSKPLVDRKELQKSIKHKVVV